MSKTDLAARPLFARRRDAIEAHLTIVFTALALSRTIQHRSGLALRRVLRTLRPLRSATIAINGAVQTFQPQLDADQRTLVAAILGRRHHAPRQMSKLRPDAVVLVATGVNADGHREVLGVQVTTSETAPAWLTFFQDLVARGLAGVKLVTSDAHAGLVAAIGATLPGATWQRCRTHYAANLMSACPKASWPAVKAMLHSVYDQPEADLVAAQFDKMLDQLPGRCPKSPTTWTPPAPTSSRSPRSPRTCGDRSGRTTPTSG